MAQRTVLRDNAGALDSGKLPDASDAGDARAPLHLMRFETIRALRERGTEAAAAAMADLRSPDLDAGTIQDGTARGLMARLEEIQSLCKPPNESLDWTQQATEDPHTRVYNGKDLRRQRDILVASGGARMRVSRKTGCLLVDRKRGIHEENCIQFEDQADAGCLDGFRPRDNERPRLFSPAFLRPAYLHQGPIEDRLILEGQLGRGAAGHPCRVTLVGRKDESGVRLSVWVLNRHLNHRLRIRFLGLRDRSYVSHRGTPGFELVHARGKTFLAATLVRACGRLRVGDGFQATPDAQLLAPIEHHFGLGLSL